MTALHDAERILHHHEDTLFADANVVYASVCARTPDTDDDFVIEIGVLVLPEDPSRERTVLELVDDAEQRVIVADVVYRLSGEVTAL